MDSAGLGQRSLGSFHEHVNELKVENFHTDWTTVSLWDLRYPQSLIFSDNQVKAQYV